MDLIHSLASTVPHGDRQPARLRHGPPWTPARSGSPAIVARTSHPRYTALVQLVLPVYAYKDTRSRLRRSLYVRADSMCKQTGREWGHVPTSPRLSYLTQNILLRRHSLDHSKHIAYILYAGITCDPLEKTQIGRRSPSFECPSRDLQ